MASKKMRRASTPERSLMVSKNDCKEPVPGIGIFLFLFKII